ncbi:Predicted nucleic acid-binding protein, contains PIN domain [Dyella sp. OK004]|uniref:PIN domain-containing protein n=1 Tax=Dyella sp. OK004 TaxID=1855292 RepID=UPI0008F2A6BF|nr:PIN domain-containing protein [Dyella sp. OK004]SFS08756.1 Predicted nucleic acid-binding protein, contains PIN domain [Dyella sp. OK004]
MSSPTDRPNALAHRLVLDTNVCLDLFVFADRQVAVLREALLQGALEAVTNEACRDEWRRVLGYSQLALNEAAQAAALASYDQCVRCLAAHDMRMDDTVKLPRCADPDDQKFLELAFVAQARWLLSKDKEVLRLGRRTAREGWFAIVTPAEWLRTSS